MEKILIVEDESIVALELQSRLTDLGYLVCGIVVSGPEAIKLTAEKRPDIILMDINIKGPFDGVETAEKIKGMYDIPIIFLTAFTDSSTLERAKIAQPYGYIVKPFEERELHTSIEIALYKHNMERKLRDSEGRLSTTLKNIGDAVIATDSDGKINYINPAAEELTSCNYTEAIGKYVLEVLNIFDIEVYNSAHNEIKYLIATGVTDDFPDNIRISSSDGNIRIVEPNVSLIKDERSNIDGIVLVLHDITEKSITKNALVESEKKYREVVENASEVIFGLDINWRYKYANDTALRISEYSIEELKVMNFYDLVLPHYKKFCKSKLMKQYLTKEKTTFIEYPFKSKSGKIIWFAQSNTTLIENDKVIGFDIIARDITEKKIAEIQLNERNEFIEMVLENIHTGLVVSKIETKEIILVNNKFERIFGYSKDQIKYFYQILDNGILNNVDYLEELKLKIYDGIKLHDYSKLKYDNIRIISANGVEKYITLSIIPIYDQDIFISSIEDITYKKKAEEQILKLSRAVEQSPISVVITSIDGNIEYVNPKFEDVTGYSLGEVVGKNPRILSSGLKRPSDYKELWDTILSGNDWTGEFQNKKKSGEFFWVSALISPVKDTEGKTIYFLALQEDITERKKTEFELIRSKEKAEEMNMLKSVFLTNMSHELRTPMVGILGFSQILRDELTEPNKIEIVDLLIKSGKRLLSTLESILDFSQLESKQINMNLVNINILEKVEELIKNFHDRLADKKLKLNLHFNDRKLYVSADDRLVNQVLNNIIDNAIKFTLKGEISIETDKIIENNSTWGIVKISDTGIGISKEKQKIIFEDFRQASEGRTRSFEGNGLGLTVANKMVEMLNGYITVESELGKGATFTVYLPAVSENKDENEEQMAKDKNNLPEILLVEDNEMNKAVVMIYLKKVCKVDYAKDGSTAIQMALQKKYSAILMDINLGNGMSGLDVMKRIKENKGYKDIPFVAITGYAMYGDKEKLIEEGCTHYLSKPFLKETLVNLVMELIDKGKYSRN